MRKSCFFSLTLFIFQILTALPNAWINEIHYDNEGIDRNEFVEVVVEDPDTWYLGDLVLYMYNGYDGVQYCLDCISEFSAGEQSGNYRIYVWEHRGIQNDTEGMVLVFRDTLIDIIAYEGSFTGNNTPADGLIFPDIGIAESGSGPDTCSIYLSGLPGSDWTYGSATPGRINSGQVFSDTATPVKLERFSGEFTDSAVHLLWRVASETETLGYRLYRNDELIAFIDGKGTTSATAVYEYIDRDIQENTAYTYTLAEVPFRGNSISLKVIDILTSYPGDFGLGPHFPNPANPGCVIPLDVYNDQFISIKLFDLKGNPVMTVFQDHLEKGHYDLPVNMRDLASGNYIGLCRGKSREESFEITLIK
jgi:hypothetical protein